MAQIHQLGKKGEKEARIYLQRNGYQILETNWRYGHNEIDIIAQNAQFIVFCEVKTRSSSKHGSPAEAVDDRKQKFMVDAAEAYLIEKKLDIEIRYDIISVIINKGVTTLEHIADAFTADLA